MMLPTREYLVFWCHDCNIRLITRNTQTAACAVSVHMELWPDHRVDFGVQNVYMMDAQLQPVETAL